MSILNLLAFVIFILALTCSAVVALPENFVPDETWTGDDGQVCQTHDPDSFFLVCYKIKYYHVEGSTANELRLALRNDGPRGYFGYTDTEVRTAYSETGMCMIAIISIIELPLLISAESLTEGIRDRWEKMLDRLKAHEWNHHQLAVDTAWLEYISNCHNLDTLLQRIDTLNKEYDRITRHGSTEGVRF